MYTHVGVSINGGTPNGLFGMENTIKMDDLGVALLQETISINMHKSQNHQPLRLHFGVAKSQNG